MTHYVPIKAEYLLKNKTKEEPVKIEESTQNGESSQTSNALTDNQKSGFNK